MTSPARKLRLSSCVANDYLRFIKIFLYYPLFFLFICTIVQVLLTMDNDFVKADSRNLPQVDAIMVGLFFKNNPDFYASELKNVKTAK